MLKLIISHKDENIVNLLRNGFQGYPGISVLELPPDELPKVVGLDAVYLSVMGAERWGARPIVHKAQILRTRAEEAENGFPPYVVAGGVFNDDDPRDPRFQLEVVITSVLEAIRAFNLEHDQPIRSIGFWAEDLLIGKMEPIEMAHTIAFLYAQR